MYTGLNWVKRIIVMVALAAVPLVCQAKNLPDVISLDSLVKLYDKVEFNHAKHIESLKDCAGCHHHTTGNLVEDPELRQMPPKQQRKSRSSM